MGKLQQVTLAILCATVVHSLYAPVALAQPVCTIVADCAEIAARAAQDAQAAATALTARLAAAEKEIAALRAQEAQSTTFLANLMQKASGPSSLASLAINTPGQVKSSNCPAGHYVVGMNFSWSGTCNNQCNADGAILQAVQAVCKPLQ